MFRLLRLSRFAGSHHSKPTSHDHHAAAHDSHSSSHAHHAVSHDHHDHHGHEVGDHGHHSHKKIPAGSWHRHSDDEDVYYYYDNYGPFHTYSFLGFGKPGHPGETPDDEIYRHEIQGYIRMPDVNDNRANMLRAYMEYYFAAGTVLIGMILVMKRNRFEDDNVEKKLADALLAAQEIELFAKQAKERLS